MLGEDNCFRYRGYYYDNETGLYYLNARYYNPEWGRFINADSYGGSTGQLLSHNVFAYCTNNPVMMSDPSGNRPDEDCVSPSLAAIIFARKFMRIAKMQMNYTLGKLPAGQNTKVRSIINEYKNVTISGEDLYVDLRDGNKLHVLSISSTIKYKSEMESVKTGESTTVAAATVVGMASAEATLGLGTILCGIIAIGAGSRAEAIGDNMDAITESMVYTKSDYAVFIHNPNTGFRGNYEFIYN